MTAFFVGQRVRLIAADDPEAKPLIGSETKIIGERWMPPQGPHWEMDIGWCVPKATVGDFFEPILPEGHRPAELTVEELLPFLRERAQA